VLSAITNSIEYVAKHYSATLKSFLVYLLSNPTATSFPTLEDAVRITAPQLLDYQDALRMCVRCRPDTRASTN
jgi:hypothetical protein